MAIRLQGGFELVEFWKSVRAIGNQKLKNLDLSRWTVTLRPATAGDAEHTSGDATALVKWDRETETMEQVYPMDETARGTATEMAVAVVDFVDQVVTEDDDPEGPEDTEGEEWKR